MRIPQSLVPCQNQRNVKCMTSHTPAIKWSTIAAPREIHHVHQKGSGSSHKLSATYGPGHMWGSLVCVSVCINNCSCFIIVQRAYKTAATCTRTLYIKLWYTCSRYHCMNMIFYAVSYIQVYAHICHLMYM